jgi:hypothetical protein
MLMRIKEKAMTADLHFYFDPVCPFAWMTSKWVRIVASQRNYQVEWRFISLRIINEHIDYDSHFPPEYEGVHTAGLQLLRVASKVRAKHGEAKLGALYQALGTRIFETPSAEGPFTELDQGARPVLEPLLTPLDLPHDLIDALEDTSLDGQVRAETEEALALTGKDVGTPILHFQPPGGTAFFGPVISRLPSEDDAGPLWDHVIGLATFPGFAELKRSLRERPQLASFGVDPDAVGMQEDWHGGSRRTKK